MTSSTFDVAVCCSNDSVRSVVRWRNSLSSRVFSMAMTAWVAKCLTAQICFSGERPRSGPYDAERADLQVSP